MKNFFLFFTSLCLILSTSCQKEESNLIAIDVLLTVPENIYNEAVQLNQLILKENPNNFTLDAQHIPHITLLQCYILDSDLPKVKKSLDNLYESIKNHSLEVDQLQYNKEKASSFASLGIAKSKPLMNLHEKTIALLKPYIKKEGSHAAYVQNADGSPIDQFTLDYVPKFVSDHSYQNFNPHISLGVVSTALLDSLEKNHFRSMKFQATSVSIYQLGNFGTAQKKLFQD